MHNQVRSMLQLSLSHRMGDGRTVGLFVPGCRVGKYIGIIVYRDIKV